MQETKFVLVPGADYKHKLLGWVTVQEVVNGNVRFVTYRNNSSIWETVDYFISNIEREPTLLKAEPKVGEIWCNKDNILYDVIRVVPDAVEIHRRDDATSIINDRRVNIREFLLDFYLFSTKALEEAHPLMETFNSGAVRKSAIHNYHSIPPEWIIWLADIFGEGALTYDDYNWLKGLPLSTYIDHLFDHLLRAISGDSSEDNWGKVAWNALAIKTTLSQHPELNDTPWGVNIAPKLDDFFKE